MLDEKNNRNSKQDLDIVSIKKDIEFLKNEMDDVRKKVTNDLPHQIAALDKRITEETNKIKDRIFYGGIVGLGTVVIVQVLLKLF